MQELSYLIDQTGQAGQVYFVVCNALLQLFVNPAKGKKKTSKDITTYPSKIFGRFQVSKQVKKTPLIHSLSRTIWSP